MRTLWELVYGDARGVLALFSGRRGAPGAARLSGPVSAYFDYPDEMASAEEWCQRQDRSGREVYHCAHLLVSPRRIKANAAPVLSLYVDGDGAKPERGAPQPTATVHSSPGREQYYYGLLEPVSPEFGERLNRRLAFAMGADISGWDLTQLLRVPGTHNRKYEGAPLVRLGEVSDVRYDPAEFDRSLPPEPGSRSRSTGRGSTQRSERPENVGPSPDLSRLSARMRELIRRGNRGEYPSRSEADFAACLALFAAGYSEPEVWATMTDPANGISQKFMEKSRDGECYLGLTIANARACLGETPRPRREKVYARSEVVIRLG